MVRTWIDPIFDRTYGHVQDVQNNPDQENPKGCWNAIDLNRIEKNTAYCAEWMVEKKIVHTPPSISVREDDYWTGDKIPAKSEIDRIINNVRVLIDESSRNPAIASELPTIYPATQINYILANQIEYALDLMHNQPKLPLEYWNVTITNGIIKTVRRDDGTVEVINNTTALVAEDEIVTIRGIEYGESAQYQTFTYWSGQPDDIGLLTNYQAQETYFTMPYRDVAFTANFETHIPRTLTLTNGYISINSDPTAESGPRTNSYFAGDQVMIIADIAPSGKAFYEWTGTQAGLDNLVGATYSEDPSTAILTMPDCDVNLSPQYINAGQHSVTVNSGIGSGWYNYNDLVSISANIPSHYEFSHWSGNTSYLNDIYSAYQTFRMGDTNISFTAHFNYVYSYNSVQVIDGLIRVNNTDVSQADGLRQTTSYTLIPTPPDATQGIYNWTIEGQGSVSTDTLGNQTNTFTVGDGNAIITAHYAPIRTLTVTNMNNGGTTSTYNIVQGRKQRLITNSVVGSYRFNGWYENDTRISTSLQLDITMGSDDRIIEARYDFYDTYTVTLINRNNSGETTTSQVLSGNYWSSTTNDEVGDYLFAKWLKNGSQVSTSTTYGFYVSGNTTITVEYRPKETYHLTVNNGTGSGDYKERQSVTITADAGDFSHWSYSNLYSISNYMSRTTTVKLGRSDGTVTANFNMRDITVITNSGTTTYNIVDGQYRDISAGSAPTTYEFNHWELVSGDATFANQYSSNTRIYAHSQDSTVQAIYTPIPRFTVIMQNGYIWDGNDWVEQATLLRDSINAIKMKPAPTGHQFLQWEVYVNGVIQVDANDVLEPLSEQTRLRDLKRDITLKATYYIPNPEVTYTLTIERKDGSTEQNDYPAGTDITVRASYPDTGMEFYKWTGATSYIAGGIYNEDTYVHMPAQNITITETYVPEGYIPGFDVAMTNLYGQCCYETEYEDPETHEITVTENWVSRWTYPEGTTVKIRANGIPNERYFSDWLAYNHDTSVDARTVITDLNSAQTTLVVPNYDIDVEANVPLKQTYTLKLIGGLTGGQSQADYYKGERADVYFGMTDTNDTHYTFNRWIGKNGTDITEIELYDGGMFNVLTPGTSSEPQYIKMPERAIELEATYKTLYRTTIENGIIDSIGSPQGYFETDTQLSITAPAMILDPTMIFQYWTGDTSRLGNIYDPTTTLTTVAGVTNLRAVYSNIADTNGIGYTSDDLKSVTTISNDHITVIAGIIATGFIITDVNGHIYVVTNVENNISTIYRMTKITQGGNIYG